MTQHSRRHLLLVAVLGAAALAITGCAPATTGPARSSTHGAAKHSPAPSAAPALDTAAPAPRLAIPCASLVPSAEITAYEGSVTLLQPSTIAAGDLSDSAGLIPTADYLRQAGNIDCIWSAGPVDHYAQDSTSVSQYIEITVQFDAASEWSANAPGYGIDGDDGGECDVDAVGGQCLLDHLVGTGTWIEVSSRKAQGNDPDQIQNIMNSAVAAVTAAGTPAAPTTTQTGTLPLGTNCTDFATMASIQAAVGSTGTVTASVLPSVPDDPTDIANWSASENQLAARPCAFTSGAATQVQLAWLPGGAWAWAEDKTQSLADVPLQSLTLTGLRAPDTAAIRCATGNASCIVDLVLGGNWIEATVPTTSTAADRRTAAIAVAQAIVTKLS